MKIREIIQTIEGEGWFLVRTRGSHRQYHHGTNPAPRRLPGTPDKNCTRKR